MLAHKMSDTLSHFLCGLVGKRKRENVTWVDALTQKVGNAICKHTRLARPRPRNDKEWTMDMRGSLPLWFVESTQKICRRGTIGYWHKA
jgi:hypothetical protein